MWLYQWVKKKFFLVPKTKKISIIDKKIFVGREEELAILKLSLEKTIQKQGQFCILYGEMGYGKTYLWKQFHQTVLIKKTKCIRIQVACSKETSPYTAFEPIFQIISAINKTIMANNIALEIPMVAGENKQKENHQILFLKIIHFLKSASLHFPIIIFLDNAQWCDSSTLDLCAYMSKRMNIRILWVVSFRSTTIPPLGKLLAKSNTSIIKLTCLSSTFSHNFLHQKFYPHIFPFKFLQNFAQITKGIPLYWNEYSHFLLEEDIFVFKKNMWHLIKNPDNINFPPNIHNIVKERLRFAMRRKNYKFYTLLHYASTFDGEFPLEWLALFVNIDLKEFWDWATVHKILVPENTNRYSSSIICKFNNEILKSLFYQENETISQVHLEVLKKLLPNEEFRSFSSHVVYHSEKSLEHDLLIRFCYIAAKEEKKKLAYRNAIYFCLKALKYINKNQSSVQESKILLCLASCFVKIKELKKAVKYLDKIKETQSKDYIKALFLLVEIEKLGGKEKKAIENIKRIIDNLSSSPQQKIMGINKIAQMYIKQKNWKEVFGLLNEGMFLAEKIEDPRFKGAIYYNLGKYYFKKGDWQKSLLTYKNCLATYNEQKNLIAVAQCINHIAYILYLQGNLNESIDYYNKTIDILEEMDTQEQKFKVYVDFAKVMWRQQQCQKSLKLLEKSQHFYASSSNFLEVARIHIIIAQVYLSMGNFLDARQNLEKCIDINYQEKDLFSQALCVEAIGLFFLYKNDWLKANLKFRKTIDVWQKLNAEEQLTKTLYFLAECYWQKKETDQALHYFYQSLESSKKCEDLEQQAKILDNIAEIDCFRGNWVNANQSLKQSIDFRNFLGITLEKSKSYTIFGHLYLKQGLLSSAEPEYLKSYELHSEQNDVYGQMQDIMNIGMMHLEALKYEDAYKSFSKCLEYYQKIENIEKQAFVHEQMARYYRKKNNFAESEKMLQQAIHLKKESLPWKKADTYYGFGRCYFFAGSFEKSVEYFQYALDLYKSVQNNYSISKVLNNMGEVFIAQKKLLLAMEYFSESYILKEKMHDIEGLAYTHMHIGRVYMRLNRIDKATENFEKSIIRWSSLGHHEYVAELSFQLGDLYEREGQIEEARNNFKRAYHFFKNIDRERLAVIDQKLEELD